ncbi:MAG TPA: TIGR04076 family protein [Thermoclostridium sp.]|nr:TIGR04076 family protein [Clostridiaceae bacterium]HOQ75430.1 TIGR04076 family protein [Thermoclostridium sp.]HPU45329.1 TIGR04076 family protein [Thermoclostridium sp.]
MNDVRITVVANTYNKELVRKYGVPDVPGCPNHKTGQAFISKEGMKPDGFCDEAWLAIERYVFALSRGARNLWPGWVNADNISVISCTDGLRPTVFLLEAIE